MLEMRDTCERCATPLPWESEDARICSYEWHILRTLCRRTASRKMPELRRSTATPADTSPEDSLTPPAHGRGNLISLGNLAAQRAIFLFRNRQRHLRPEARPDPPSYRV